MNDALVDIGIKNTASNRVSPSGVLHPVLDVVSFLDRTWSDRFTSSFGFSMVNISNSDAQTVNPFHQEHYSLGNGAYHIFSPSSVGVN